MNTVNTPANNTLVIFASPHSDGCTKKLLERYLQKKGILKYTLFDCYKSLPAPCTDCGYCKTHNGCSGRDLDEFYSALEECTRLIIAAPVYNNGFPAPLKALVDRLQLYFNARFARNVRPPIKIHKTAALLTCQGADKKSGEHILAALLPAFTVINAELGEFIQISDTDSSDADVKINDAIK